MEQNKKLGELSQKMMEGLRLVVSKFTEQSTRDNQQLVVSNDGKI